MGVVVDTADAGDAERFERWSAAHRRLFPALEMRPRSVGSFTGRLSWFQLGAAYVGRFTADASTVRRTPRTIGKDGADAYHLALLLRGRSTVSQDDRSSAVNPGDLTSYSSWEPYEFQALTPFDMLVVTLPQALLHPHVERTRRRTATAFPAGDGAGQVLRPFLVELIRGLEGGTIRPDGASLGEALLSLVHALHDGPASDERSERGRSHVLWLQVTQFIDEHLGDADLSREVIARQHFISVSYLDKLFEAQGVSTWQYIRNKRLDRCRRDLADPRLATESILTIASGWGFANAAHFSRSFSRAFGESPRDFRAAACRASEPAPPVRDR